MRPGPPRRVSLAGRSLMWSGCAAAKGAFRRKAAHISPHTRYRLRILFKYRLSSSVLIRDVPVSNETGAYQVRERRLGYTDRETQVSTACQASPIRKDATGGDQMRTIGILGIRRRCSRPRQSQDHRGSVMARRRDCLPRAGTRQVHQLRRQGRQRPRVRTGPGGAR